MLKKRRIIHKKFIKRLTFLTSGDIMNILNVTFNAINANRNSVPKGKLSVNNNIKIDSVEESNIGLDKTKTALKIGYTYKTEYSSDFAKIEIKGDALALAEVNEAKDILDKWKKDKSLEKDSARIIINNIMSKCSFESILMAKELGLPSPIPMPMMKADTPKKEAKK